MAPSRAPAGLVRRNPALGRGGKNCAAGPGSTTTLWRYACRVGTPGLPRSPFHSGGIKGDDALALGQVVIAGDFDFPLFKGAFLASPEAAG